MAFRLAKRGISLVWAGIMVGFKGEEGVDGEEIGKVFIYDEDDVDTFLEEVRWMKISDARRYAEERGYEFEEN